MNRRNAIKTLMGYAGKMSASLFPLSALGVTPDLWNLGPRKLKRVIFFLQNQGFDPETCISNFENAEGNLSKIGLAPPMRALEPLMRKMHIISGLHGIHTTPMHSAYFGALGGYHGGMGVAPSGITIDYALSQILPQTIMPHLGIGADSLDGMKSRPSLATLTAAGPRNPVHMHCNPQKLYQMIFGSVAEESINSAYNSRSLIMRRVEYMLNEALDTLSGEQAELFSTLPNGYKDLNELRSRLSSIPHTLKKYKPDYNYKFTNPQYETDWHDAIFELGIAALRANLTNVLTFASGRGEIFGSYHGLDISTQGHTLGHMQQAENDIWYKIRSYNCDMLLKLYNTLESTPEVNDSGSMMDHSLIVYTSNNANKQHTRGEIWPVVLIGDAGGQFKTNHVTNLKDKRPLNDFYTTLLRAAGSQIDFFNLSEPMAKKTGSQSGPIEELFA